VSSDAAAAAAASGLSTDVIGCTSVGVRAGYAHGKACVTIAPRQFSRLGSCGHADRGPDECRTHVMDAGR